MPVANPGLPRRGLLTETMDLAAMIAVGGDCPQDIDLLRTTAGQHPMFGQVASAPAEPSFIDTLATTATVSAVTDFQTAVKFAHVTARALAVKRRKQHRFRPHQAQRNGSRSAACVPPRQETLVPR